MKQRLKRLANGVLNPLNLRLTSAFNGILTGQRLDHDLALIIPERSPLCLDVGANRGQTIELLRQVLDQPVIHAFEPSTTVYEELRRNCQGPGVFVHNLGVGAEAGELVFNNLPNSTLSSFLKPIDFPWEANTDENAAVREVVTVTTVDLFAQQKSLSRIDLLKSDTQGFDLQVLKGAEDSLKSGRVRFVLVEINFHQFYKDQSGALELYRFLEECGFYVIDWYEKIRHPSHNGTISWCTALFGRRDNTGLRSILQEF